MVTLDLFPDRALDPGERPPSRGGGARPIGRWRTVRPRLARPVRARRPSTAAMLAELRHLVRDELGAVVLQLRRIEQRADSENIARLLRRLTAVERCLQLIEPTPAPRVSRRRPLA